MKEPGGKATSSRIERAEGGFTVESNHERKPNEPYREPKKHVFTDGHAMLRHVAKTHGIRFGAKREGKRGGSR